MNKSVRVLKTITYQRVEKKRSCKQCTYALPHEYVQNISYTRTDDTETDTRCDKCKTNFIKKLLDQETSERIIKKFSQISEKDIRKVEIIRKLKLGKEKEEIESFPISIAREQTLDNEDKTLKTNYFNIQLMDEIRNAEEGITTEKDEQEKYQIPEQIFLPNLQEPIEIGEQHIDFAQKLEEALDYYEQEEQKRLDSYKGWTNPYKTPLEMVKAGFSYKGERDLVECNACRLTMQKWGALDDPWQLHSKHASHCSFIQTHSNILLDL